MRCILFLTAALSLSFATADGAEVERATRVFDLRFLLRRAEASGVVLPAPVLRSRSRYDEEPDTSRIDFDGDDSPSLHPEAVGELIKKFIDPDSWHNSRNSIDQFELSVVVTQTPETLQKIVGFLALLDARASRVLVAELAMVPPESIEKAAPGSLKPGATPWFDASAFDAAILADPARAAWLTAVVGEGGFVNLQPQSVSMIVRGHEVNQTGILPVVDPAMEAFFEGTSAKLRLIPLPQEGWLRADLKLRRRVLSGKPERRKVIQVEMDLPKFAHEQVGTSVIVPEGKAVLLGSFSPGEASGKAGGTEPAPSFAAILRVRRMAASLPARSESLPQVIEVESLLAPPPDFFLSIGGSEDEAMITAMRGDRTSREDHSVVVLEPEILLKTLAEEAALKDLERFQLAGGTLFHVEPEPASQKIRARLHGLARERLRLVTVDLWQGAASPAEIAGDGTGGALLELGWIERMASRPGVRARICSLMGARGSLASVLSRRFISDVEMISGGTGEINVVVAQPVVGTTGAGLLLNASCDLVPGSTLAQLHVRGELARPPVFGRQARARASLEVEPSPEGEKSPIQATAEWVTLDLPDEDGDRWEHLVTAPLGRPVLLNALPDPAAPGKARALVAVVHEFELRD